VTCQNNFVIKASKTGAGILAGWRLAAEECPAGPGADVVSSPGTRNMSLLKSSSGHNLPTPPIGLHRLRVRHARTEAA
jgi:hypothetical protein